MRILCWFIQVLKATYPWPTIASCFMLHMYVNINRHFHVDYILAHTQHAIDLLDPKPMQNIRHQGLKTHVFHASNVLGPLKIFGSSISASFSSIINEILYNRESAKSTIITAFYGDFEPW